MTQLIEIGWMGMTANPVHDLHLVGAQSVVDQFDMTELLLGPNGIPPHKSKADVLDGKIRMHLLELSVEGNPKLVASSIEIDRALRTGEPSYTVDTLQELTVKYDAIYGKGNWRLNCVVGEDVVPDFKRWRDSEGIKKLSRIIIIPRYSGVDADKEKEWRDILQVTEDCMAIAKGHAASGVSSTAIRAMIKAGSSAWRYLVREKVYAEIVANGYYLDPIAPIAPAASGGITATAAPKPADPPAAVDQADGFAPASPVADPPAPADQADGFAK